MVPLVGGAWAEVKTLAVGAIRDGMTSDDKSPFRLAF
jgi:hypothetical protein